MDVLKFRKQTTDEKVIKEIFTKKEYDKNNFISGDNWLDLGAHIGVFATYAKTKGIKNVYCYEPHPENFKLLLENIGNECYNLAVYGSKKPSHLYLAKNTWRHTIFPVRGRKRIEVKSIHINDVLKKHFIENIKIDIEGAESDVLLNLSNFSAIKKIIFEYSVRPKDSLEKFYEIEKHLQSHGFKLKYNEKSLKYLCYRGYPDILIFAEKN